jgi:ribosome-associated protein
MVALAEDKQAHDITLLDIRQLSTIADYFVICSGDNERQLRAIIDHIDEGIQQEFGLNPRIEGTANTGWVILDYDDVVVHVFGVAQRMFYQLESLYTKAIPLVVVQ